MTDEKLLKCATAVLDFLMNCDDEHAENEIVPEKERTHTTTCALNMYMVLKRNGVEGGSLAELTLYLNTLLGIDRSGELNNESMKVFFTDKPRSIKFYSDAIAVLTGKTNSDVKKDDGWQGHSCWYETACRRCGHITRWSFHKSYTPHNHENWCKLHRWALDHLNVPVLATCEECKHGTVQDLVAYTDSGEA